MPQIHPTAIVDSKAQIADDVQIGPYCIVGPDVKIGSGTKLIAQCFISGHTTIGERNIVYPNASIGTEPQDFGFKGGYISYVRIGNDNVFREGVTVNAGTKADTETVIGNNCYFMINSHIAHNCKVGNKVILVNCAGLSGYAELFDNCIISGLTGIHQFCRVGRFAFLSGGSTISKDLPPFMIGDGRNGAVKGVNVVGMQRNGFSDESIRAIKNVFKIFCKGEMNVPNAIVQIRNEIPALPEVNEFIEFVENSKRGVLTGRSRNR